VPLPHPRSASTPLVVRGVTAQRFSL